MTTLENLSAAETIAHVEKLTGVKIDEHPVGSTLHFGRKDSKKEEAEQREQAKKPEGKVDRARTQR